MSQSAVDATVAKRVARQDARVRACHREQAPETEAAMRGAFSAPSSRCFSLTCGLG